MSEEEKQPMAQDLAISFAQFLEDTPPNSPSEIADLAQKDVRIGTGYGTALSIPELQLYCPNPACSGPRFFRNASPRFPVGTSPTEYFLKYLCSNCRVSTKTFAIRAYVDGEFPRGAALKLGEIPTFGPPTPSRLIQLIGPDRDLFLKGRRCENQGLGIAAFVYYRRVIESQKSRILGEIVKVAERVGAAEDALAVLRQAAEESQFSKALESVKHSIPQALLIGGHNPLTLLHGALSEGLHGKSDEECLELASHVRVVLAELSERLSQALKDEAELKNAVAKLSNVRAKR